MSGIVGIVHFDGAPVDRGLLGRMTSFLAFRGPDAQEIWVDGYVGLGHTLLKTTDESEHERQPFSLDGRVWIVADARVDARAELIANLRAKGPQRALNPDAISLDTTDVELILRAYRAWGEDCLEHLLGDFAFAIWDGPHRRLFCARDHMGVKPFFYAHVGQTLIFSNTLDCIRQHPAVSGRLNDLAIADFLLFGQNQDPGTTTFVEINRLPAAHEVTWREREFGLRRYWTLPVDDPLVYPRAEDYTDRFQEILHASLRDRLRNNHVGIFMSGGLDSPAMAAATCEILRGRSATSSVEAFTEVYDRLMPHHERYYAGMAAKHLGIPIQFWSQDDEMLTPWGELALVNTPEPVFNLFATSIAFEHHKKIAAHNRVLLYGEGPDNALGCDWRAHLAHLVRQGRWRRLLPDFWFHVVGHPRIPFVGRLKSWAQGYRDLNFPTWINQDLASRLRLTERWEMSRSGGSAEHPTRPKSYLAMSDLLWQDLLDGFDVAGSRTSSEVRHPFLDVRFIRFLLAVPAIPWCCDKNLVRRAVAGILPDQVVRRSKSPLAADPFYERARRFGMPQFPVPVALRDYVRPDLIPKDPKRNIEDFRSSLCAVGICYWLHQLERPNRCIIKRRVEDESGPEPRFSPVNLGSLNKLTARKGTLHDKARRS